MSFRNKIFAAFSIVTIVLIMAISFVFYYYSSETLEKNSKENLKVMTDKLANQLSQLLKPMEFISWDFIASREFMEEMATITYIKPDTIEDAYDINKARVNINQIIHRDSLSQNFYGVNVFNKKGDFFTSNNNNYVKPQNSKSIVNQLPWAEQAQRAQGKSILIAPYDDPWENSHQKVFGLARVLRGHNIDMGYIEVQVKNEEFENIFILPQQEDYRIVVLNGDQVLYQKNVEDTRLLEYYQEVAKKDAKKEKDQVTDYENPQLNNKEIFGKKIIHDWDITILLVQDYSKLMSPVYDMRRIVIAIGLISAFIAFIGMSVFSKYLTRPIRELQQCMESIEIRNLPEQIVLKNKGDEIESLNQSFQDLRTRLNDSIEREIQNHSLVLQANLDMLQAQINPHFLFNVLNMISNKGMEQENYEIGEICEAIASLLRYSTSTAQKTVTLSDEIDYTKNYLMLMEKRFEDRLKCVVEVDDELLKMEMPKMILQPLVENALNHGYRNTTRTMFVSIYGIRKENEWKITVKDSGEGFDADVLSEIKSQMSRVRNKLFVEKESLELEIGGMGIVNTYLRLMLCYGECADLEISNKEQGAEVVISAPWGSI